MDKAIEKAKQVARLSKRAVFVYRDMSARRGERFALVQGAEAAPEGFKIFTTVTKDGSRY